MLNIPTPTKLAGDWTQRTALDGIEYQFRYCHASLTDSWTLDISVVGDLDSPGVITGKKLFIGKNLLRFASHTLKPKGRLFVLSQDGSRLAPGLNDLGDRVKLYYLAEGESFPSG